MHHMSVVVTSEDEVVAALVQEVAATVAVGVVVTSPTSHRINSHHVNCVEQQTMQSSSAIKGLTHITWEKKRTQTQHLMEWTRIGTLIRVRLIT
jgi:hypothetical protein